MFQKGDHIGSYSLIEKLGKGSFGEVWLAEEKTAISSHKVALKLPNEEDVDKEAIRQEADVWESVKGHPNILPIIKADIYEGQIYIASEYAPDGSLSEWLKNHGGKAPTVEIAIRMINGILAGLEHLHSKGVIHRDLKPANILLQADTPRIADFGIARLAKTATTANSALSAGTPSYMAPECFYSVRSEQTDIWAVGVLFHKLLSGKLPFSHPDQVSVMNAILNSEPNIDPEIPAPLQNIIRKALQKDTAQRYKSAADMRADLSNFDLSAAAAAVTKKEIVLPAEVPIQKEFDREEETVVRSTPSEVYVQPVWYKSSNQNKTLAISLASLLILAALTVWAALQFAGNEPTEQTGFSDLSNESNTNSNLINGKSRPGNQANFSTAPNGRINSSNSQMISNIENPTSSDGNVSVEPPPPPQAGETPTATPEDNQPKENSPNVNAKARPRQTETPSTDQENSPTPTPTKTPAPTPVEIAPLPPPSPRGRTQRPTPKPTAAQPGETPPLLKSGDSSENNPKF